MNRYVALQVFLMALAVTLMLVADPLICGVSYIVANGLGHAGKCWDSRL